MTTTLREQAEDYLRLRRALGFTLVETEKLLMQFISHLESINAGTITVDEAVAWARQPTTARPAWWRRRLMVVRLFARHLQAMDPATEVPVSRPAALRPGPGPAAPVLPGRHRPVAPGRRRDGSHAVAGGDLPGRHRTARRHRHAGR